MIPPLRKLRQLTQTTDGLAKLVADGVVEHDHLDFKATYNQRDPKYRDEVRKDCAGLATSGEGFLVVGVEESRDGVDRATKLAGLPLAEAQALKTSISGLLEQAMDPPFGPREKLVRVIPLTETHAAVTAHLRGRTGYPKSVKTDRDGTKYLVRVGANTIWLTEAEARVRRHDVDVRRTFRAGLLALLGLALALVVFLADRLRRQDIELAEANRIARQAQATAVQQGKTPPRRLTKLQQDAVVKVLSGHPHAISVEHAMDLESQTYADDFEAAFRASGWTITPAPFGFITRMAAGLQIIVHDVPTAPTEAVLLQEALKNAGIEANGAAAANHVDVGGIDLFVGPKP